jgi:DEAD/DEAH box helicase/PLD-like domain
MVKNRHAMKVPSDDGTEKYITRVAETVRLLGHTVEYWHNGRPGVDAVRWLVEYKKVPKREIPAEQFIADLSAEIDAHVPVQWKGNLKAAAAEVLPKVAEAIADRTGIKREEVRFSKFQFKATREMLLAEFAPGKVDPAQIITAGVGSGKTFAFLIPVMISSLARVKGAEQRTVLLLYPRKALAKDQYEVAKLVRDKIGHQHLDVWFEHADSHQSMFGSVAKGLPAIYGDPEKPPPSVIVTTLETLKRRLQHPLFATKVGRYAKRAVVDEVHLVEGLTGANVLRLMDRLRAAVELLRPEDHLLWTGSSATVAQPHLHAGLIFNLESKKVEVIEPAEDETEAVGLAHHVFLRPSGNFSSLGALVNATSIVVHNRRADVGDRPKDGKGIPKTIGFADSLDLLGRWNADLRENERTENTRERPHPDIRDRDSWKERWREIPYAIRFNKPLQRRLGSGPGDAVEGSEGYSPVPPPKNGGTEAICDRCKKGERIDLYDRVRQPASVVHEFSKLVYRDPAKPDDSVKMFYVANEDVFGRPSRIGTLDLCPYLRAGACYWFPCEGPEAEGIPKSKNYEFRSVARSKIHSSKTPARTSEPGEVLGDIVFTASAKEIYDVEQTGHGEIPVDIVLASPSLEVGVDLTNVTESMMYHAIRNVASYRQKAGRIAREEGSDGLNVSLLVDRPIDLHYYRQPRKLVSLAQLDPIPLRDTNDLVLRGALYMATWDWLALRAAIPETIPKGNLNEFSDRLEASLKTLKGLRSEALRHLSTVSRGRYKSSSPECNAAVDLVASELELLLSDVRELFPPATRLADVVPSLMNSHLPGITLTPKARELLDDLDRHAAGYARARPRINPISLGLTTEFEMLDLMNKHGWSPGPLDGCITKLKARAASDSAARAKLTEVVLYLELILNTLQGWSGNPLPLFFFKQARKFVEDNPTHPYLSDMMSEVGVFQLLKAGKTEHIRLRELYSNPYEEQVEVSWRGRDPINVGVSEAMFSLIPGTWTYRFDRRPVKVKSGRASNPRGGVAVLRRIFEEGSGCEFKLLKTGVPGPLESKKAFDVMLPVKVSVESLWEGKRSKEKYVWLDFPSSLVIDNDEAVSSVRGERDDEKEGKRGQLVKIPRGYLNRWVDINPDHGKKLSILDLGKDSLAIVGSNHEETERGEAAASKIVHPLAKSILDGAYWHEKMEVTEFVYSVSRTYTSQQTNGLELVFEGPNQSPIGIGRRVDTEGVSLVLDTSTVEKALASVKQGLLSGKGSWAPTALKAFAGYLSSMGSTSDSPASPFIVRDIISVVAGSLERADEPWTVESLEVELKRLKDDEDRLRSLATLYYSRTSRLEQADEESRPESNTVSEKQGADLKARVERLVEAVGNLAQDEEDVSERLDTWLARTLLYSFGTAACNALQRFSGVTDADVGFAIDSAGIKEHRYRVFLYDRDVHGNGSSEVARRLFYILHIQRHGGDDDSRLLPSDDFYSVLEEELLQCSQHHTDLLALEMHKNGKAPGGWESCAVLGYVSLQAEEVLRNSKETWRRLGIAGREDAWKLPLMRAQAIFLAQSKNIPEDDVVRASTICWNGCPECLVSTGSSPGGLNSEFFLDKAVLDEWFRIGRLNSKEYWAVNVKDLAAGKGSLPFGNLSEVVLNLENRRIRSVSLPYTIGIDVGEDPGGSPTLIVRTSDIEGLSLLEKPKEGAKHGIESLGFLRLLWHDLIMTSYLHSLDLIPPGRQKVEAVFYDCRDIDFRDAGVSPRMLEAILEQARTSSPVEVPERLSDMLAWLRRRGFEVSLVVDKTRLAEEGVRELLERLEAEGCEISTKALGGLMHKKAIISPLSAIEGSANLTVGGTVLNEEILNYAQFGTDAYVEIGTNVHDTFYGAIPWREAS